MFAPFSEMDCALKIRLWDRSRKDTDQNYREQD